MPAWKATGVLVGGSDRLDSRSVTGGGGAPRGLLVIGEVATAVLLLCGGGLLLRYAACRRRLRSRLSAPKACSRCSLIRLGSKYPTPESLQQFYEQVEAETRRCAGRRERRVGGRSAARFLRFRRILVRDRRRPSRARQSAAEAPSIRSSARHISRRSICLSWPDAPSIGVIAATAVPVCIVNEAFARTVPRAISGRPANRVAADRLAGGETARARDCRCCAAGEGPPR